MKKFKTTILIPVISLLLVGFSTAAFADTTANTTSDTFVGQETYTSFSTLSTVTLPEHTSYVSDEYFGVINVSVDNDSVVAATADTQGHVVMTGVSSGNTTVYYWYKTLATDSWKKAKVPVVVSASATKVTTAATTGLVFPQTSTDVVTGSEYTVTGITNNGAPVDASSLLWVTPSNSCITVDASTGKVNAVSTGTATLYAFDPKTNNSATITITVH
jgi:hypothetical protein